MAIDLQTLDWKKLVRTLAPAVATAFGTPVMGLAVGALSTAIFGDDAHDATEVTTAIQSGSLTSEQFGRIKEADIAFQQRMGELKIDLAKLEAESDKVFLQDIQDARARQVATKDIMPQVIFFMLFALYISEFMLFYFGQMPTDDFVRALITRAFSTVEVGTSSAIAYFIGSSRGSARKTELAAGAPPQGNGSANVPPSQ